jgi:hypothetical protein
MAAQPDATGYLSRATNAPSNAAGWAVCFWFRRTGAVGAGVTETLWELSETGGTSDYLRLYVKDTNTLFWEAAGNVYEDASLQALTLNQWYFICARTSSATTGDVLWRADNATSFSSSARAFETDNGWDAMTFMNNGGHLEAAQHFEFLALKVFIGTLTDAQIWEQSVRMLPRCSPAILDCYLPLYTGSGADEGGRARNWTVTANVNTVASQPAISRGGAGRTRVHRPTASAVAVTFSGPVTASAAIQQPALVSMQPVAMGAPVGLSATVQQPAIAYPVTMGGPVAASAVVQQPSLLSTQPVSMGGPVALIATVQQPAVSYPVTLGGPVAMTATVQQPAVASMQPVSMGAAIPLLFTVHPPTVAVDQINALPVTLTLAVQRPAILDPYPHDYPRRSRRERRRSTMG